VKNHFKVKRNKKKNIKKTLVNIVKSTIKSSVAVMSLWCPSMNNFNKRRGSTSTINES
jgi:hypothetical protein